MTTAGTLLIRAFDAGDTYVSFRWLDRPSTPVVHRVPADTRDRCLAMLDRALIAADDGEDPVRAAVLGPLSCRESEAALARELAALLLPGDVLRELLVRSAHSAILIRIIPSKLLARVPFELLAVDGDRRLIEIADLCYEPAAALHVRRARIPRRWQPQPAERPVLYVVDPLVHGASGIQRILSHNMPGGAETNTDMFLRRLGSRATTDHSGVGAMVSRWDLSAALQSGPGRFVYFGHVSSTIDEPGSASLHLSDDATEWGLAEALNQAHRPLSALDLFLGTEYPHLGPRGTTPLHTNAPGHRLWPMPARVALIACESGVDFRSSETFGLVTAMFHAGAQVVTSTRWALPSDTAFAVHAAVSDVPGPTTELALAVDETHEQDDPVRALADWQRHKLRQWRTDPGPATSPLTWAAVICHVCEPREVRPSRQITRDRIAVVKRSSGTATTHRHTDTDHRPAGDLLIGYEGIDRRTAIRSLIAAGLVALDDGEYDQAQDLFEIANAESTHLRDNELMAIAGNYLGVTAIQTGEYHVAESSLRTAIVQLPYDDSTDLTDLLADIRINLANVYRLTGRHNRAERRLRKELRRVRPDTLSAAKCTASLGFLYADKAQYADAVAYLEDARSAFDKLGAADDAADCRIVAAHVQALNGDVGGAIQDMLTLRELLVADDRPDKVAYCDYNLANLCALSHEYTAADEAYDRALGGLADTGQHHRIPYLLRNRSHRLLLEGHTHPHNQDALAHDALDMAIVALIVLSHHRFQFPDTRRRTDWSGAFAELVTTTFSMAFDFGRDDLVADLIESGINEGVYGNTHSADSHGTLPDPAIDAPIVRRGGHRNLADTLGAAACLLTTAALPLTSPPALIADTDRLLFGHHRAHAAITDPDLADVLADSPEVPLW